MARVLVEQFLTSYARPPRRIVLDCDDTEDPVHGGKEQARYDGYDGGSCFLPLHLYARGCQDALMTTLFKAKRFPRHAAAVGVDTPGQAAASRLARHSVGFSR